MSTLALKSPQLRLRKRSIAIGLSLLLAAGATGALVTYVHGVENRVNAAGEVVPAFVAKGVIKANTSAEAAIAGGAFEQANIPRHLLAVGAVTTLSQLAGKVAAVDILPGEQILASRFVSSLERPSLLPIPEGHQALTVQADMANSVGGFVQPGDHVSVIAKVDVPKGTGSTAVTHYLVQNVSVLAVGQTIASANGTKTASASKDSASSSSTSNTVSLTLAVTPSQAEKLAYAILLGDVYFTLVPNGDKAVTTAGRSSATIFGK